MQSAASASELPYTPRLASWANLSFDRALKSGGSAITVIDFVSTLLESKEGAATTILRQFNVSSALIATIAQDVSMSQCIAPLLGLEHVRVTSQMADVFRAAREEARALNHPYLGTEHILLGIIRTISSLADLLASYGLSLETGRSSVEALLGRVSLKPGKTCGE